MIYIYIFIMAITTYLIRMLPLTVFQKEIKSRWIRDFLYYVPYACLTAMTIPVIFYATASVFSAAAGLIIAIILGWRGKSLVQVAVFACLTVFIVERILGL